MQIDRQSSKTGSKGMKIMRGEFQANHGGRVTSQRHGTALADRHAPQKKEYSERRRLAIQGAQSAALTGVGHCRAGTYPKLPPCPTPRRETECRAG
jgi:hypothetical protein